MTTEIYREDPPAASRRPGPKGPRLFVDTAETLKNDPGQWYRIATDQKHAVVASRISTGTLTAFRPKGAFEAAARKQEDGSFAVWARYVGEYGEE